MKENGRSKKTYYDLVRDDLMGNHPRILNLLLVFVVVSLSSVAIFLASDILSSGSHGPSAVHKGGLGELFFQVPKEALAALKNWQDTGKIANQIGNNGLNGSNKTKGEQVMAENTSQPGPAVSSNSSLDRPSPALQQASGTNTPGIAGSTNSSSTPVAKRNHSSGGKSKNAKGNDSRTIGSQLNETRPIESQSNETRPFEPPQNQSLLNTSQLNQSQMDQSGSLNRSQMNDSRSGQTQPIESRQNRSSLNASQLDPSHANQSESTNQSQMNDSLSSETQLSQAETTNQSRLNDSQPGIAEPINQTPIAESLPSRSKELTKSEGEIKMDKSAEAIGSNGSKGSRISTSDNASKPSDDSRANSSTLAESGTNSAALSPSNSEAKASDASLKPAQGSNLLDALAGHQVKAVGPKIDEGASLQGEPQMESPLPDLSLSKSASADAGKGIDTPSVKTLKFDSAQEKNNGGKVSSDLSGKSSKTVAASKSSAEVQNAKKEETAKQRKPIRAPRKPAQPRQVKSASHR